MIVASWLGTTAAVAASSASGAPESDASHAPPRVSTSPRSRIEPPELEELAPVADGSIAISDLQRRQKMADFLNFLSLGRI